MKSYTDGYADGILSRGPEVRRLNTTIEDTCRELRELQRKFEVHPIAQTYWDTAALREENDILNGTINDRDGYIKQLQQRPSLTAFASVTNDIHKLREENAELKSLANYHQRERDKARAARDRARGDYDTSADSGTIRALAERDEAKRETHKWREKYNLVTMGFDGMWGVRDRARGDYDTSADYEAVVKQRGEALRERDIAIQARDAAVAARDKIREERDRFIKMVGKVRAVVRYRSGSK